MKVHEWGNECIDTLSEAERYCLLIPSEMRDRIYVDQKDDLLGRLSALIDRGRMFFRNKEPKNFGRHKPSAYQGIRPAILDPLVAAYMAIEALNASHSSPDPQRQSRLWDWRREFVSVLQEEIHNEWLKKATKYEDSLGGGAGRDIDADSEAPSVVG